MAHMTHFHNGVPYDNLGRPMQNEIGLPIRYASDNDPPPDGMDRHFPDGQSGPVVQSVTSQPVSASSSSSSLTKQVTFLFVGSDGAGVSEVTVPVGTPLLEVCLDQISGFRADNYLVLMNKQRQNDLSQTVTEETVRVSVTPTKMAGQV